MARSSLFVPMVLGLIVAVAACEDDDDPNGPDEETFEATLTGAKERPNPVTTEATGEATFTVDGQTVDFTISVEDLQNATAAHIHGPADANTATGVLVTLFAGNPPVSVDDGTLVTGTFPSAQFTIKDGVSVDSVLTLMRNGLAYVNVHTSANPPGEIRGQIEDN
jgi:hypothetical protein